MNMHAQAASGDVQWSDVESMSSASLDSYRSTAVGPYLMACRIDALRAQGNYQEALAQSENLLGSLSKSNPLYPSFQVKDALLNLDYGDDAAQQRAQATLQAIGSDAKNPVADRALYYLGSYQESIGEHEQARQTWQQLVELGAHEDRFLQSPYLSLVQSKL
jgi:tetratricopeptide (TPR) repeat protein